LSARNLRNLSEPPACPECGSSEIDKAGFRYLAENSPVQRYLCKKCGYRFSQRENSIQRIREFKAHSLQERALRAQKDKNNLEPTAEIKTVGGEQKNSIKGQIIHT
jgi:predicted Zn-ribbon and HTH transcriptional regulator